MWSRPYVALRRRAENYGNWAQCVRLWIEDACESGCRILSKFVLASRVGRKISTLVHWKISGKIVKRVETQKKTLEEVEIAIKTKYFIQSIKYISLIFHFKELVSKGSAGASPLPKARGRLKYLLERAAARCAFTQSEQSSRKTWN